MAESTRKRIPLGTRNILTAPTKKGFNRRFVNDIADRVNQFKEAGWAIVDESLPTGDAKLGKATSIGSITNPVVSQNQRAILMEIPSNLYAEDASVKQSKITQVESEIKRNSKSPGKDGLAGSVEIS